MGSNVGGEEIVLKYSCSLCTDKFESEISLLLHFQKNHYDEDELLSEDDNNKSDDSSSSSEGSDSEEEEDSSNEFMEESDVFKGKDSPSLLCLSSDDEIEIPEDQIDEDYQEELEWLDIDQLERLISTKKADNNGINVPKHLIREHVADCDALFNSLNICETCGEKFETFTELQYHITILGHIPKANPERPHVCSICKCGFTRKTHLIRHMTSHSKNEATLTCNLCKKRFKTKNNLKTHYVKCGTHDKSNYVQCDKCKVYFKNQRHLNVHYKAHSKQKPHQCNLCQTSFARAENLRRHVIRFHSEDYQLSCRMCKKTCHGKAELNAHMQKCPKKKLPSRRLQCKICSSVLSGISSLSRHMRLVHSKTKTK